MAGVQLLEEIQQFHSPGTFGVWGTDPGLSPQEASKLEHAFQGSKKEDLGLFFGWDLLRFGPPRHMRPVPRTCAESPDGASFDFVPRGPQWPRVHSHPLASICLSPRERMDTFSVVKSIPFKTNKGK